MSSIGTGYDLYASQFSPEGKIFQIEYANKAVENSGTAIAMRAKDGVVFAVETIITSKLHESGSNRRMFNIDKHIGMVVAGLLADARHLVETAREECASYKESYNEPMPCYHLAERLSYYIHAHTLYSAIRPFGVSILLGSLEADGPHLHVIEPSGLTYSYYGCAVGKAKQNAKTEIEKLKISEMTCKELIKEASKIIYQVHDEIKDKHFELDLSWVGEVSNGIHELVPRDIFDEAEAHAKQALAEADDSDEDL